MQLSTTMRRTGRAVEKTLFAAPENGVMDMDILDKLAKEHDEVVELLTALVECEASARRKTLLKEIKAALVPHVRAEEKVVYDAVIAIKDREAKVNGEEGYFEHQLADKMLMELGKISNAASPEFTAAAKVLRELIEHHVDEEETNVWKDVREFFDEDQRFAMNRDFEKAKKKVRIP